MYIQEAAAKAIEEGKEIKRKSWMKARVYISQAWIDSATGQAYPEILHSMGSKWIPKVNDLLADDWELTTYQEDTEPRKKDDLPPKDSKYHGRLPSFIAALISCLSLVIAVIALLVKG